MYKNRKARPNGLRWRLVVFFFSFIKCLYFYPFQFFNYSFSPAALMWSKTYWCLRKWWCGPKPNESRHSVGERPTLNIGLSVYLLKRGGRQLLFISLKLRQLSKVSGQRYFLRLQGTWQNSPAGVMMSCVMASLRAVPVNYLRKSASLWCGFVTRLKGFQRLQTLQMGLELLLLQHCDHLKPR